MTKRNNILTWVSSTLVAGLAVCASTASAQMRRPPMMSPMLEYRTIDGSDNNLTHSEWGAAESVFPRYTSVGYGDGLNTPSGNDRPSARLVSNIMCSQSESIENSLGFSDYLWQWGQFLDHDITETPLVDPVEEFDIIVPTGDPSFDPFDSGVQIIDLDRSFYELDDQNIRQQVNLITSYIDASNVYGSDEARAHALRSFVDGKLKVSEGNLLPYNEEGFPNAGGTSDSLFLAGDVRVNEQVGLTAMHTLFLREHNTIAEMIKSQNERDIKRASEGRPRRGAKQKSSIPAALNDEEIYQLTRAIIGAEMQVITYHEFLPALLGEGAIPPYQGYNPALDASISNVFATAAYRLGHTMLSPTVRRLDANNETIHEGDLSLAASYFSPQTFIESGPAPILRGLAKQKAQEMDTKLVNEVRNFLFGIPGSGGFDLAALNIQRSRDHGLPDYNQVRVNFGLPAVSNFSDITNNVERQNQLAATYANVNTIDPWVGLLAEDRVIGSYVGETLLVILSEQFIALRDGDRFWYQNQLPQEWREFVENQKLSTIIRRNTEVGFELQNDVFRVPDFEPRRFQRHIRGSHQ